MRNMRVIVFIIYYNKEFPDTNIQLWNRCAICWVNLGILQWHHLLCNCVIIFFNCHGSLPYYLQQSRNAVF